MPGRRGRHRHRLRVLRSPRLADLDQIRRLIAEALPGADVEVIDEGGGDHLRAVVAAPQFDGLSRIDQHRLVKRPVQHLMDDGTIHALSVTARLP